MSGFYFSQGIDYVFPDSTKICSGEIIIICRDTSVYGNLNNQIFEWGLDSLENNGELIELRTPIGYLVDKVDYDSTWGFGIPGGLGPTLELIDTALDNNNPSNWKASYCNSGTPGQQ